MQQHEYLINIQQQMKRDEITIMVNVEIMVIFKKTRLYEFYMHNNFMFSMVTIMCANTPYCLKHISVNLFMCANIPDYSKQVGLKHIRVYLLGT